MNITPILIAVIPGIEVRGSFIYSFVNSLGIVEGYVLPFIVSFAIIPLVYLLFDFAFILLSNFRIFAIWLERIKKKTRSYVDKYGFMGLAIFVAIPLPGSGLYTGTIGAHILGFERKKAIPALFVGNLMSGILTLVILFVWGKM